MRKIRFTKMSGAGNDFVLIDNRSKRIRRNIKKFVRFVCFRQKGIGSDGLILLESSRNRDFKMRIFNPDGSEAEMCGNGARCIAQFSRDMGIVKRKSVSFDTVAGTIDAYFTPKGVRISLGAPKDFRNKFSLKGLPGQYCFVNTGVPHVVSFYKDASRADVVGLGRKIRFHSKFLPAGTNVNFVQVIHEREIYVRTYERGVERETLACGTGAAACSVAGIATGKLSTPVKVKTTGGDRLYIHYRHKEDFSEPVYLEGSVVTAFKGEIGYNF